MSNPQDYHNVICSKCGATASSKCPYCRSVFQTDPTGHIESMLSHAFKIDPKLKEDSYGSFLQISLFVDDKPIDGKTPETTEEALIKLRDWLNLMIEQKDNFPSLQQYLCQHNWQFMEGKHSQIGCGH